MTPIDNDDDFREFALSLDEVNVTESALSDLLDHRDPADWAEGEQEKLTDIAKRLRKIWNDAHEPPAFTIHHRGQRHDV